MWGRHVSPRPHHSARAVRMESVRKVSLAWMSGGSPLQAAKEEKAPQGHTRKIPGAGPMNYVQGTNARL